MSFFVELWDSILTPGTTPALVKATHGSFAALLVTLLSLLYLTRNIHFVFLTLLASSLWAAITWFIWEVENEKAKQKAKEALEGTEKEDEKEGEKAEKKAVASTSATASLKPVKSRRI